MGILAGWWLGVNDGRTEQPYLPSDQWDRVLRDTGFSGVDAAIFDAPEPWHINASIISRPAENISNLPSRPPLSLLLHQGDEHSEFVQEISSVLAKSGFQMELCTLQNPPPAGKDIVSVLELETPFFESISQADLVIFQGIVGRLEGKHLLWITRPAQENVLSQPGFGLPSDSHAPFVRSWTFPSPRSRWIRSATSRTQRLRGFWSGSTGITAAGPMIER